LKSWTSPNRKKKKGKKEKIQGKGGPGGGQSELQGVGRDFQFSLTKGKGDGLPESKKASKFLSQDQKSGNLEKTFILSPWKIPPITGAYVERGGEESSVNRRKEREKEKRSI